jgi:hypothetical protein
MLRTLARHALPAVAALFTACTVVQVFLAGLGVFDGPGAFVTHREFGWTYGWLTLAILVLALAARAPRRITGVAVLLLVLFALQSVFVVVRADAPAVAALHPLNGFAILALGGWATRAAWAERGVAGAVASTPVAAAPAVGSSASAGAGPAFDRSSSGG